MMAVSKIKEGRTYRYQSRAYEGRGVCHEVTRKSTGWWVTLLDEKRNVTLTVRPSQVFSSR